MTRPFRTMYNIPTEQELVSSWRQADAPLLSICCITFNHEQFIDDALRGFLIQKTTFPFEILIHDDASSDRTADVIRAYAEQYPTVFKTIYQSVNQYSRGVKPGQILREAARGKYIAFCEGDDYWTDPSKLQQQVGFLEKNNDYVLCTHDCCVIDEQSNLVANSKFPRGCRDLTSSELISGAHVLTATNTYVYRNVFEDYPLESRHVVNGDRFLLSYLGQFGQSKFLGSIQPACYRVHRKGVWSSIGSRRVQLDNHVNLWFWLYTYYSRTGKTSEAAQCWRRYLTSFVTRLNVTDLLFVAWKSFTKYGQLSVCRLLFFRTSRKDALSEARRNLPVSNACNEAKSHSLDSRSTN